MAATYHHARRLYIGTTAERAAVVLDVDGMGTEYWDTTVSALYIWDGTAWVSGFAALPHDILSASHGDTTPVAVVRGDLMTGQGVAPLWARLALGNAHEMFKVNAAGTDPGWEPFDWDEMAGVGGADMVHDHSAAAEGSHIPIMSLGNYVQKRMIRGGVVDWETFGPAVAGEAIVSTGITPVFDQTPNWTGAHTFGAGLIISAGQGITMPDGSWIGIPGNELLTVDAAGLFAFSGVAQVRLVADGTVAYWSAVNYNNVAAWLPAMNCQRARGTLAAPAGVQAGDQLGGVLVRGYHSGGAWDGNPTGSFVFAASQNHTAIAQGTNFILKLVPDGGVVQATVFTVGQDGTVRMNAYGAGDTQFLAGGVITSVSDRSLKRDVCDTGIGLAEVLQMQGKRWRFTEESGLNDRDNTMYQGFIADDIEKIVPAAVGRDANGMRTMSYSSLMPAFAEAFREVDARLRKLEAR